MGEPRIGPLAVRGAALAGATLLLDRIARHELPGPPASGLAALSAWAQSHPPDILVLATIRDLAVVAGSYLTSLVALALAGAILRHRPTTALAVRLSPPSLRSMLALAATATVLVAVTPGGQAGAASQRGPALRRIAPPGPTTSPSPAAPGLWRVPSTSSPPAARRTPLRSTGSAPPTRRRRAPAPLRRPARVPAAPSTRPAPAPTIHVVRAGEDFWSIASAEVRRATGKEVPEPTEIARYWVALVRANRSRLPVPGDPDLLFPGDRVEVPPLA